MKFSTKISPNSHPEPRAIPSHSWSRCGYCTRCIDSSSASAAAPSSPFKNLDSSDGIAGVGDGRWVMGDGRWAMGDGYVLPAILAGESMLTFRPRYDRCQLRVQQRLVDLISCSGAHLMLTVGEWVGGRIGKAEGEESGEGNGAMVRVTFEHRGSSTSASMGTMHACLVLVSSDCIGRPTFSPASKYEVASTLITRSDGDGDDGEGDAGFDAGVGCGVVNAAIVLGTRGLSSTRGSCQQRIVIIICRT